MKLADQLLNKVREGQEEAESMAFKSLNKSIGKDLKDAIGKSDAESFMRDIASLFNFIDGKQFSNAILKAAKEHLKGAEIEEGRQFQSTKVRNVTEGFGSRKARLTIKEACNMMEKLASEKTGAPYPRNEADMVLLKEAKAIATESMKKLKMVKESRKGYKK